MKRKSICSASAVLLIIAAMLCMCLSGCGKTAAGAQSQTAAAASDSADTAPDGADERSAAASWTEAGSAETATAAAVVQTETAASAAESQPAQSAEEAQNTLQQPDGSAEEKMAEAQESAEAAEAAETPETSENTGEAGPLIVIDAGHQQHANLAQEPIGPGASETKYKVSGGTSGAASGLAEYQLTLMVAQKLQAELEARGYQVLMVRTENDVDISNAERAEIANNAGAAAFIRLHANGSSDTSVSGAMTICQTAANQWNGALHDASYALSEAVLDGMVAATGCNREYVWETDTMSGINWCQVPVTIVEMGYMTNPEEDRMMADDAYQQKLAAGIADGIDKFVDTFVDTSSEE